MSSTFDTMQAALSWLGERVERDKRQAQDVILFFSEVISELHTYSHEHRDALNRGPQALAAQAMRTALRHEDDEERAKWLKNMETG